MGKSSTVIKPGDMLRVIWADHEISTSQSAKNLIESEPCFISTKGTFVGESADGIYYIINHNSIWDKIKGDIDSYHNDHTRILISGIADITRYVEEKPKKIRRKAKGKATRGKKKTARKRST